MYVEYKNVPVHEVQGCAWSTGNAHGVWDCISLYTKYKLSIRYDMESLHQIMICMMSLSHYNHTSIQAYNDDDDMQSCFHLYRSHSTNYLGWVGKLALHNSFYKVAVGFYEVSADLYETAIGIL